MWFALVLHDITQEDHIYIYIYYAIVRMKAGMDPCKRRQNMKQMKSQRSKCMCRKLSASLILIRLASQQEFTRWERRDGNVVYRRMYTHIVSNSAQEMKQRNRIALWFIFECMPKTGKTPRLIYTDGRMWLRHRRLFVKIKSVLCTSYSIRCHLISCLFD